MTLQEVLPATHEEFGVFRSDFVQDKDSLFIRINNEELRKFGSIKGRAFCAIYFLSTPIAAVLTVAFKIIAVAVAVILTLKNLPSCDRSINKRNLVNLADRAISLVITPVTFPARVFRFLLGVIHPGIVFSNNNTRVMN